MYLVDDWLQGEDQVMSLISFQGSPSLKDSFPYVRYVC